MTDPLVQYCELCAKDILQGWKGWPHKDPVPLLPRIYCDKCEKCGSSAVLENNRITWFNHHGAYSTGLPDYWLLVVDDGLTKWGKPYYGICNCSQCDGEAILSEMNYPNGEHEFKCNCGTCGVQEAIIK